MSWPQTRNAFAFCLFVVFSESSVEAQWTSDPGTNLPVCNATGDQVQPKIVNYPGGGSVLSWFDNRIGGFDVFAQRLDEGGNSLWTGNGVLIKDRAVSSTEDYGLDVDSAGNTVLAYGIVNFSSLGVQKLDSSGSPLWGAGGITVNTPGGSHTPKVVATTDGNYVVAWSEGTVLSIVLQKYDANGNPQWGPGVVYTDPPTSRSLFLCDLHASDNGSVIAFWFRCTGSNCATSAHHLYTQKYDSSGVPVWNGGAPIPVFNTSSTANGYFPTFVSDGAGGAVYGWYETGGTQNCYVQRINAAGVEMYAHNGIACTAPTANRMRISASPGFDPATGDMFMAWSEVSLPSQNMWGVRAQKISAAGAVQWGSEGISVKPMDSDQTSFARLNVLSGGAVIAWLNATGALTGIIKAARLDANGAFLWAGPLITPCTRNTGKSRLDMTIDGCGMSKLVWSDGASGGSQDLLAQNVRREGSLGPLLATPVGDMDCDADVTTADMPLFVDALINPSAYLAAQPCCLIQRADTNSDTLLDGADCAGFVTALLAP